MKRALLTLALALSLASAAVPRPVVGLSYQVVRVDPVEREFYGAGQTRPVIGVFSTVYRIEGQRVPPSVFWRKLAPGDRLDAKVRQHELFSIAVAADINLRR